MARWLPACCLGLIWVGAAWTQTAWAGPLGDAEQLRLQTATLAEQEQSLASRLAELDGQLGQASQRLSREQAAADELGQRLRRHVLALERLGRTGSLSLLVLAPSLADLHRREMLLRQAVVGERELLRRTAKSQRTLRVARDDAARVRQQLATVLEQRKGAREALQRQLGSRQALMDGIRRDPALAEATGKELDASAAELRQLVEQRTTAGDRWPPLLSRKGALAPPTQGKALLNFGVPRDPQLRTTVRHLGIDLLAPVGTPVTSVHPGAVVFAGALTGYGGVVIVAHGQEYHTVYAQLGPPLVAQGSLVEAGTTLGAVGEDPLGGKPHLHFEVRHRGQAEDPREWLGR